MGSGGTEVAFNGGKPCGIQPTFVSVDQELIRRVITVVESAIENASECMMTHDHNLGRTTRKNKYVGDMYERDVEESRQLRRELRVVMGWPADG
jgi:hypothetical protein